ncbi:TIGR00153 family protein [bacterium]|nr:TIGR00153 family protein [bacterium]
MARFFRLLARSPFGAFRDMLAKVDSCVEHVQPMLAANLEGDFETVKQHFRAVTVAEHEADEIKDTIRDNLPRSLFLPIDRWHFLDIISSADEIADRVEDLAYLLTVRNTTIPEKLKPDFENLTVKALECYGKLTHTVSFIDELIEAGFAGPTADKVLEAIQEVCHLEWETDKIGYKLSQGLFALENEISAIDVVMIRDIAHGIAKFADSAEGLAKDIRRMLAH